jgi:hypothetical protein
MKRLLKFAVDYQGSLAVILLSTILTLLALQWIGFDLRHLSDAFIGNGGDDLGTSWFIYQAMDNLIHRPLNLGYSTMLYGESASFTFSFTPYGIAVLTLPVYFVTNGNLELTYNLYWITAFSFSAWAMYVLVRYLLGTSRLIGVVVALMVTFAQWRFLHIQQVELLAMQFLLLSLYCLHRFIDSPRPKWSLGLAVAVWFTLTSNPYYGLLFLMAGGIILFYVFIWHRTRWTPRSTSQFIRAMGFTVFAFLPFLLPRLQNPYFRTGFYFESLIYATPLDWLRGNSQIYAGLMPYKDEVILFLGFTPIILSLLAWHYRKRLDSLSQLAGRVLISYEIVMLYAILVIFGYLMTLGPLLRVSDSLAIPLPYLILLQIPGVGWIHRIPIFFILAIIGTGLLSAYILTLAANTLQKTLYRAIVLIVIVCLFFELTPFNGNPSHRIFGGSISPDLRVITAIPRTQQLPPIYEWLQQQPAGTPVFHYPNTTYPVLNYLAYQRFHSQPMLNGYGSFLPPWYEAIDWKTFPSAEIMKVLFERRIQYVLVHHEVMTAQEEADFKYYLTTSVYAGSLSLIGTFGQVDVYQVVTSAAVLF